MKSVLPQRLVDRGGRAASWLVTGRWTWRVGASALLLTAILHPPVLGENAGGNWETLESQAVDPLSELGAPPSSHAGKLAFRLLPPLLLRTGLGFGGWLILQAILGAIVFALIAALAERQLGDRCLAAGFSFAVAATYVGGQYVFDDHAYFDSLALAGLTAALVVRPFLLQVLALEAAVWTDERAAVAIAGVVAYAAISRNRSLAVASLVVLLSYAIGRQVLEARYGLATRLDPGWISTAVNDLDRSIPALWLALKGLWIVPLTGAVMLLTNGRMLSASLLLASVAASGLAALSVLDVTRSAVYLLPSVIAGLVVLASDDGIARLVVRLTVASSLLLPTMFVIVPDFVWVLPLPFQILS